MIPARLIRTVPKNTTAEVEAFWSGAQRLHPRWDTVTYRDPIDPGIFPITSPHWEKCTSGAQFAGLVRLEALYGTGGIYLDSDVELFRPLDSLRACSAFAAWEDDEVIPDAVLGAEPHHPAILACLELALERLNSDTTDWRTGPGAWGTGPGVTTTALPDRPDVLVLPPGSFYPVHYSQKNHLTRLKPDPWTFGVHHWHGSWVPKGA